MQTDERDATASFILLLDAVPPLQHRICTYSPHSLFTILVRTGSQMLELMLYMTSLYGQHEGPTGLLPMITFLPLPAAHACRVPATETAFAKTSLNSVTQRN